MTANIRSNHFLLMSTGTEISERGREEGGGVQEGAPIREIDGYLQPIGSAHQHHHFLRVGTSSGDKQLQENHARECRGELQEAAAGKWPGTTTLIISRSSRDTTEKQSAGLDEVSTSNQRPDRKPCGPVQSPQQQQQHSKSGKSKLTAIAGSEPESSPPVCSTADWTTLTFDL